MRDRGRRWCNLAPVSLTVVASLAACLPARPAAVQAPVFTITLDTAGGFSGRGRGGVTVDADGRVRASRMAGITRDPSLCRGQLASSDLESLQQAVAAAGLQPWPASFDPPKDNGCCDRFKWTLRLEQRDAADRTRTWVTTWHDGNEARLSKELAAIREIALSALTSTLAECGRQ